MNYNFKLDNDSISNSLKILKDQCWKLLPIFEGKEKEENSFINKDLAYINYQKQLDFLITKVLGASKLWQDNQYYVELAYLLSGMKDYSKEDHDKLRYMVFHCIDLIEKMGEVVEKDAKIL